MTDHVVLNYDNKRVFPSATPHTIGLWAEAELGACAWSTTLPCYVTFLLY